MTTPGVSHLTKQGGFQVGIVISASHNPYHDNGIKFFQANGQKFTDAREDEMEKAIDALDLEALSSDRPSPDRLLKVDDGDFREYSDYLASTCDADLRSLRIVLDCANGAAYRIAPELFRTLGAEVIAFNDRPDGRNINDSCGALHPETMAAKVVESGANFGAAFDGDADRVIVADATGEILDGDHLLYLLSGYLSRRGALPSNGVVSTVMSNMGLESALERDGIELIRTPVGDRWVWAAMLEGGHWLGGEQSGHIILREHQNSGDGVLVALKVAELLANGEARLEEVRHSIVKFPQKLVNVAVREKVDYSKIPEIRAEILRCEARLGTSGRVLIRYSGTEPKVRIMIEAEPGIEIEPLMGPLVERFRTSLGSSSPWDAPDGESG